MVVRLLTYRAGSREEAEAWAREQAGALRAVPGLERVSFVYRREPPRAGALLVFASDDALARYREEGVHERIVGSLWDDAHHPIREETYRVIEVHALGENP